MTDAVMPDWIKDIKQDEDTAAHAKANRDLTVALATKTIQADGPVFWKQFLKELEFLASALQAIGFRASTANLGSPAPAQAAQIYIILESVFADQRYVNFFYDYPGAPGIRCVPQEGQHYTLRLVVDGEKLVALNTSNSGKSLDPEGAARSVVEPIVRNLKGLRPVQ